MNEFEKHIMDQYNIQILEKGIIKNEGFYYVFQLSPQQQRRICSFENYQIKEFILKSKMSIIEIYKIPLAQINGTYNYAQGKLRLSGSKVLIGLMLYQLFVNTKQ